MFPCHPACPLCCQARSMKSVDRVKGKVVYDALGLDLLKAHEEEEEKK